MKEMEQGVYPALSELGVVFEPERAEEIRFLDRAGPPRWRQYRKAGVGMLSSLLPRECYVVALLPDTGSGFHELAILKFFAVLKSLVGY